MNSHPGKCEIYTYMSVMYVLLSISKSANDSSKANSREEHKTVSSKDNSCEDIKFLLKYM